MVITYSKIVGANVVELKTQSIVGQVSDLIIQKTDLQISGMTLAKGFLDKNEKTISASDVVDLAPAAVVVRDQESISSLNDNIRMKESYKDGYRGIYQRVETRTGKKVGIVFDYLVESKTLSITKFYVRTLLTEKIIGSSSVVELRGKVLVIKDDFETARLVSPAIKASIV